MHNTKYVIIQFNKKDNNGFFSRQFNCLLIKSFQWIRTLIFMYVCMYVQPSVWLL